MEKSERQEAEKKYSEATRNLSFEQIELVEANSEDLLLEELREVNDSPLLSYARGLFLKLSRR